jgi:deoxynucleoside triphosphate triphosphohydrolase SAMHD1
VQLQELQTNLEAFASSQLEAYTNELSAENIARAPKEFSDPVWKTIYLTPFEIALIDSPLFQRLRLIRQLGVAHWVYPGAVHTRFEHSLGTLFQIQELIESINRAAPKDKRELLISPSDQSVLRLTALCHDLGHGVMSHVSENALKSLLGVDNLRLDFVDAHPPLERIQLSEMVAYFFVGSPAFRALVEKAKKLTNEVELPDDACSRAQKAIIGEIISNKVPLLQELITGPFDCDKLDYMQRDALMAGVPAVTDVPRLVRKLRAVACPLEKLPEELQERVNAGEAYYVLFGLAFSGTRTLDELLLGRIMLFDKLYRHQKVRAVEGMVCLLLFNLLKVFKEPEILLPYLLTDEELLFADRAVRNKDVFEINGDSEDDKRTTDVIQELSQWLRERTLFVRAFAFAKNMPGDPYRHDPEQRVGAGNLLSDLEPTKRGQFVCMVAKEVHVILDQLGLKESVIGGVRDSTLESYIYVDPPQPPAHAGNIPRAFLVGDDGQIRRFRDTSTEMRSWADAYLFAKDIGFVFCPRKLKPYVFLAVEKILREQYKIRSSPAMFDYVKLDDKIEITKRQLQTAGYYSNLPHDLRPKANRLQKGDIPGKFRSARKALQGYSGPYVEQNSESPTTEYLADKHLEDWLQQFETESLIASACNLLSSIRLIGRRDVVSAVKEFINGNHTFQNAIIAPLGDIKDSGPSIAYFSGDIGGVEVLGLREALQKDKPIILVDDFIGSGNQAVSILESLLSEPITHDLNEGIRFSLAETEKDRLRQRNSAFIYAAGWTDGRTRLEEATKKYSLNATVYIGIADAKLPSIHDNQIFGSPNQQSEFIGKCKEIGEKLLVSDPNPKHDQVWATDHALGYGNRGLLVTFPYNTPSQTLTCLWLSGEYAGLPWQALLPRRKKK